MKHISSASNMLLLLILLSFHTSIASKINLLRKDILQSSGSFLQPDSAQKMRETNKQWSDVNIYENIFPNESNVAVFKNVHTQEILWETINFTASWTPMPKQVHLVWDLRHNDSAKWKDVFVWFSRNTYKLIANKSQNNVFLKRLLLAITENIDVRFTSPWGTSSLMLAAAIDDTDLIVALIERGADVTQQDKAGCRALHIAAFYGSLSACKSLLKNDANIDAANIFFRLTPLMLAAKNGHNNVYKFLIENGANETLTDYDSKTALQYAKFEDTEVFQEGERKRKRPHHKDLDHPKSN